MHVAKSAWGLFAVLVLAMLAIDLAFDARARRMESRLAESLTLSHTVFVERRLDRARVALWPRCARALSPATDGHVLHGVRGALAMRALLIAGGISILELLRRERSPQLTNHAFDDHTGDDHEGQGIFSFVHIDDAAEATAAALECRPGAYNIVDGNPSPQHVWLTAFARAAGAPAPPRVSEEEALRTLGADAVYYATRLRGASNEKARRELEFRPRPLEWI